MNLQRDFESMQIRSKKPITDPTKKSSTTASFNINSILYLRVVHAIVFVFKLNATTPLAMYRCG